MTTLHDLAREIVDALSANAWTLQPPAADQVNAAIIERCDGLQLRLMRCDARGWADVAGARISIRTEPLVAPNERGDPMRYDYDRPTITVAATRTPASIAGDIRSRLLPDAESWYRVALHWQEDAVATHARLTELRRQLLAYPGVRSPDFSHRLYGDRWTCEPRVGSSVLVFELSPDLIVKVLTAYHQLIEEPMSNHQPTDQQQSMFPAGDDLPIFSGAPVRAATRRFDPQPESNQSALLDLRPTFGDVEPAYTPKPEVQP